MFYLHQLFLTSLDSPITAMSIIVLSRGFRNPNARTIIRPLLYPTICTTRAASLTRAIGRGIRRSKGVGFRGKERGRDGDTSSGGGENLKAKEDRSGVVRKHVGPPSSVTGKPMTYKGWEGPIRKSSDSFGSSAARSQGSGRGQGNASYDDRRPVASSRSPPEGSTRIRMGKRILKDAPGKPLKGGFKETEKHAFGKRSNARKLINEPSSLGSSFRRAQPGDSFSERNTSRAESSRPQHQSREREHSDRSRPEAVFMKGPDGNASTGVEGRPIPSNSYDPRSQTRDTKIGAGPKISFGSGPPTNYGDRETFRERTPNDRDRYGRLDQVKPRESREDGHGDRPSFAKETRQDEGSRFSENSGRNDRFNNPSRSNDTSDRSRFVQSVDKRIPISIPYTTPASEFLYGTSVVESALKSTREHRRKLYKLYIYAGENRENATQDAALERLAKKNKVEVAHVGGDWLRAMDKMSNSRPHNGYILESSPLPRLPVTSLGAVEEDLTEFQVVLDHQSREEAAVNGSSNIIKLPKNPLGRKPFVLFLDSILDPGNLGGIIRTASFLGVTAIAISKNCASFSPIVLKASAGASEDITIFTVNKPAGFIANSKLAGWKVFAAVAPSGDGPLPTSTDNLVDPLIEDPCILMLGGEGEGLRLNLKTKANVNLTIRGSGRSHSVDSLNVSVATGILCDSFLRRPKTKKSPAAGVTSKKEELEVASGDLF